MTECAVPGCRKNLHVSNITTVCREHMHYKGICECWQCRRPGERNNLRIKTREELVEEGLLPKERLFPNLY